MKIAIIGAMKEEVSYVIQNLTQPIEIIANNYTFYKGLYHGIEVIVVESGIGKVSAGMLLATLHMVSPETNLVINIGVAGGIEHKVAIGDVVVGIETIYGDVDVRSAGKYVFGQMCGYPQVFLGDNALISLIKKDIGNCCVFGTIITTDKFVTSAMEIDLLIKRHFVDRSIHCFDMESAAFAQACHAFQLPFLSIRAISDIIGSNFHNEFEQNLSFATSKSNEFLERVIHLISKL